MLRQLRYQFPEHVGRRRKSVQQHNGGRVLASGFPVENVHSADPGVSMVSHVILPLCWLIETIHAAFTVTATGTPLVRTSYTAERLRDCSTIFSSTSAGASPLMRTVSYTHLTLPTSD